jgi:vitamin B12 transporter
VERIEILRGPQSTIYGSDAIGGVVQIITKRGSGPLSSRVMLQGGSYGTQAEGIYLSGGTNRVYYSFSANYLSMDGFSAASERNGNTENDLYRNTTFSGRYGWTPSESFGVDYVFRYIDATKGIDGNPPPTFAFADELNRTNITEAFYQRVQLRLAPLDGDIESKLGFSVADYDRFDTNPAFGGPPAFFGQTRKVDWQNRLRLTNRNTLVVGADYFQEDADSDTIGFLTQTDPGFFVEDQITLFDRWYTTFGGRWDDYSTAGPAQTYRVTTAFNLRETATIFRSSIGTGFRAPALSELFFPFGIGNPDLLPEESKGWDVGVEQTVFDGLTIGATYFRNNFTNLIVFDFIGNTLENIGQAKSHGLEFYSQAVLSDVTSMTLNYTRTDTTDLSTGEELLRRPRDVISLGVNRLFGPQASLAAYVLYVGPRNDTAVRLDDYVTVNMAGSYRLSRRVELFARAENLFDEFYEEVQGFGVPGISGYGGINLTR